MSTRGKFKCNESSSSGLPLDVVKDPLEDIDQNVAGFLLPLDEDELLAGVMDDFDLDLSVLQTPLEDWDDDFFASGGGMEIESETRETPVNGISRISTLDSFGDLSISSLPHFGIADYFGTVRAEHPHGEHPSRTLFVRNINRNVEDSKLMSMFEKFGAVRSLYTECKHRGFVMISYYDIRHARNAMQGLQNKPLGQKKLDIHFSIPKDRPSRKDLNQGTLVVFNLDASASNETLHQIFGAYGEVKEIRETPHKQSHRFIEFYDIRAAEAALKALNGCDITRNRITLEPSQPGGARRSLMLQLSHEQELDKARGLRHLPYHVSSAVKIAPIGRDSLRISNSNQVSTNGMHGATYQQHSSVPELKISSGPGVASSSYSDSSIRTLSGHEYLWGSPSILSENMISSSAWASSVKGCCFPSRNGPIHFGGNAGIIDRIKRRADSGSQTDNNWQYKLDLEKIWHEVDKRTTLMIKNIPNKYTSKMLLEALDEKNKGMFDFLYLPIDFKNKCNMGYAFINMVSPIHIISLFEAFNGKKWEKFNSEKVASLAYARIQGIKALVSNFQYSSSMNEDKRYRSILFLSEGQDPGEMASLSSSNLNILIRLADGSYIGDSLDNP